MSSKIDEAVRLVASGHSLESACNETGCTMYMLRKILPLTDAMSLLEGYSVHKSAARAEKYVEAYTRAALGEPVYKIGPAVGIHQETLYRWFRRIGLSTKLLRRFEIIDKIQELRKNEPKISQAETARRLKISRTTVITYWDCTYKA